MENSKYKGTEKNLVEVVVAVVVVVAAKQQEQKQIFQSLEWNL